MAMPTTLQTKMLKKDDLALIRAGFLDSCFAITPKAEKALIEIAFIEKKADLVKLAEARNAIMDAKKAL